MSYGNFQSFLDTHRATDAVKSSNRFERIIAWLSQRYQAAFLDAAFEFARLRRNIKPVIEDAAVQTNVCALLVSLTSQRVIEVKENKDYYNGALERVNAPESSFDRPHWTFSVLNNQVYRENGDGVVERFFTNQTMVCGEEKWVVKVIPEGQRALRLSRNISNKRPL